MGHHALLSQLHGSARNVVSPKVTGANAGSGGRMAQRCNDCGQKPCMGGKGNGSCVSTAGRRSKGSGGTIPRDEEPGTKKNPMIDCPDEDYAEVSGVWHKEHKCN